MSVRVKEFDRGVLSPWLYLYIHASLVIVFSLKLCYQFMDILDFAKIGLVLSSFQMGIPGLQSQPVLPFYLPFL